MSQAGFSERDDREQAGPVWRQVLLGVAIVLVEHVVFGGLLGGGAFLLEQMPIRTDDLMWMAFWAWAFGIGLSQVGYVLPTFLVAFLVRRNVAAGVALGALITFLLNGACFGVLCGSIGNF